MIPVPLVFRQQEYLVGGGCLSRKGTDAQTQHNVKTHTKKRKAPEETDVLCLPNTKGDTGF